jgi:hypothetical protein
MKLTTTTQVSVDGVMQGPGVPVAGVAERGAFERGGWAHFDNEAGTIMDEIYQRADAFLFGRRTYEIFAGSWGTWGRSGRQPDLDGIGHAAQVRGIDHTLRPEVGEHDRPLQ